MGIAGLMREKLHVAHTLRVQQDEWCAEAELAQQAHFQGNFPKLSTFFPEEEVHESLVALLRGDVRLNIHCYLVTLL
jgi:hypothetical protein